MDTPVSFEIAKLLKEKEFDVPVEYYYNAEGLWDSNPKWDKKLRRNRNGKKENFLDYEDCISAPTIANVIDWFHEKHGIWIYSYYRPEKECWDYKYQYTNIHFSQEELSKQLKEDVDEILKELFNPKPKNNSPEEAYEAAFEHILTKLI